jgi:hypothetical protein
LRVLLFGEVAQNPTGARIDDELDVGAVRVDHRHVIGDPGRSGVGFDLVRMSVTCALGDGEGLVNRNWPPANARLERRPNGDPAKRWSKPMIKSGRLSA